MQVKLSEERHEGYRIETWGYERGHGGGHPYKVKDGVLTWEEFAEQTPTAKEWVRAVTVTGREVGEHWFFTDYDPNAGYKSPEAALQRAYFLYLGQNGAESMYVGTAKTKKKSKG